MISYSYSESFLSENGDASEYYYVLIASAPYCAGDTLATWVKKLTNGRFEILRRDDSRVVAACPYEAAASAALRLLSGEAAASLNDH